MTKFVLLSCQRHGTSYFTNCINAGSNGKHAHMEGELLRRYNRYKELSYATSLKEIKDAIELSKVYNTSTLHYFYKRFALLEEATDYKDSIIGFKIFSAHSLYNTHILYEIIKYVDKIIVLDRDNLEFMYSTAHAKRTGNYTATKDNTTIFLNKNEIETIKNQVVNKYYFFENISVIAAKLNKSCLYLHYDELGTAMDKINRFFSIDLKDWISFHKQSYDYDQFLFDNPELVNFINNNSFLFKKRGLQYPALSAINNKEYEYHI